MPRGRAQAVADAGPVKGPWPLPHGWHWQRTECVAPVNTRRFPANLDDDDEITFVPMSAVGALTGKVDVSEKRRAGAVRQGFTKFASNDVIFAKITPCMENGKVAIVPSLPHGVGCGSTEFHVLSPVGVTPRFLYHWVSQRSFRENAEFHMIGTAGQKRVPPDFMRSALIPVPPIEAQNRIAARIDELFADVDDGEAALAEARTDLDLYRRALLKAAVTGELTADWRVANPPAETGAEFLRRILADRRARWEAAQKNRSKQYAEPAALDDETLPSLPEGWVWTSVEQLSVVVRGASPRPAGDPRYFGGDVPWITVGSITRDEEKYLDSTPEGITPAGRAASRYVEPGTLLLTNSGATLGVPKITRIGGCINDGSVALLGVGEPLKSFLYHYLRTQTDSLRALNQGAAQPNLNTTIVRAIACPLPPAQELTHLVQVLDNLAANAVADVQAFRELARVPSTLRQSILSAAFRGELAA